MREPAAEKFGKSRAILPLGFDGVKYALADQQ